MSIFSRIMSGNVFDLLPQIERGSVDCAVTSPPYWRLRSYLPKDHPLKALELGSESTVQEYIANQVRVFSLVRECLAEHGTCWVNIGDSYSGGHSGESNLAEYGATNGRGGGHSDAAAKIKREPAVDIEAGNLCLVPQRLAIALQDAGWHVRSIVVWHKPAPMPASIQGWSWRRCKKKVKGCEKGGGNGTEAMMDPEKRHNSGMGADWKAEYVDCPGCKKCKPTDGLVLRRGSWRPTSSWEPILMLAKNDRYFGDGEPVKTPPAAATVARDLYTRVLDDADEQFAVKHDHETLCSGANLRDVWTISSEALKEKHYAAFPTALVEKCLRAGTSAKGYCEGCGKPWVRVIESEFRPTQDPVNGKGGDKGLDESDGRGEWPRGITATNTTGWRPTCSCTNSTPRPGVVLDPFSGSARTGITAQRLGLSYIGIDLNEAYVEMSRRLLADAPDHQPGLFG